MASSLIHICVASEINKELNKDPNKLFIGTIAPDISKLIGESRNVSHFIDENNIPDLNLFLEKYKNNLKDEFVLGYFIHLYTDYLWLKYFITEINCSGMISTLDGELIKCDNKKFCELIYNDYTNLNIELIDEYKLDCKIFYNELPKFENIIKEIPMDKLDVIVNQTGIILKNSEDDKEYIFDITHVSNFINLTSQIILSYIDEHLKDYVF